MSLKEIEIARGMATAVVFLVPVPNSIEFPEGERSIDNR
jgi:hypothetical protein